MNDAQFIKTCKTAVLAYVNGQLCDADEEPITEKDIYVVWLVKALQNNKALLSTTRADGMYYECTYNGDKNKLYFDAYQKKDNIEIDVVFENA